MLNLHMFYTIYDRDYHKKLIDSSVGADALFKNNMYIMDVIEHIAHIENKILVFFAISNKMAEIYFEFL